MNTESEIPVTGLYADEAPSGYIEPPTNAQFHAGVEPEMTLPAAWWNYFVNLFTNTSIKAKEDITAILAELNNALTAFGYTVAPASNNQLATLLTEGIVPVVFSNSNPDYNPYTAGKTPKKRGDIAINTTTNSAWISVNTTASVDSWKRLLNSNLNTTNSLSIGVGSMSSGSVSVAVGPDALRGNTTGINNTAVGSSALYSNTTGKENVAVGFNALKGNAYGNGNVAVGAYALYVSNAGYNNIAIGTNTLKANTTGGANIAIGDSALVVNITGKQNIAVGRFALTKNTTGENNVAVGIESLTNNTTGKQNVGIGTGALQTTVSGFNNIAIGHYAISSSSGVNNQITLGNSSIQSLRCAVTTITAISDRRDKKNIEKLEIGLDFVKALNPCGWNYDLRENYPDGKADGSKMKKERNHGFIAQDLQEIQEKFKIDLGLVMDDNPDKLETSEGRLLPVMVKAIQELSERLEKLEGAKTE